MSLRAFARAASWLLPAAPLALALDVGLTTFTRELQHRRAERDLAVAEVAQPSYRDEEWAPEYWREIGEYRSRWDVYTMYRAADYRGLYLNVQGGVRRTYSPSHAGSGRPVKLDVFGGSAAWGHGARDPWTIPSWLSRLAEARGLPVEVRNYAESGWVNWQGVVYLLARCVDGDPPDVVLFYSGVNEFLAGRDWPGVRRPPYDPALVYRGLAFEGAQMYRPFHGLGTYLRRSSTLSTLLFGAPSFDPPGTSENPAALARRIAGDYLADVTAVEGLGRQYGFRTLFAWQATVAGKKNLTEQERQYVPGGTTPGVDWWTLDSGNHERYVTTTHEVLADGRIVDANDALRNASETTFIDWMHHTERGNELVARYLFERLQPLLAAARKGQAR